MKKNLVVSLMLTLFMMPSARAENLNLSPSDQAKLSDLIQTCDLHERNAETYKEAYNGCNKKLEKGSTDLGDFFIKFGLGLIFGYAISKAAQ